MEPETGVHIAGVISGFRIEPEPVIAANGEKPGRTLRSTPVCSARMASSPSSILFAACAKDAPVAAVYLVGEYLRAVSQAIEGGKVVLDPPPGRWS